MLRCGGSTGLQSEECDLKSAGMYSYRDLREERSNKGGKDIVVEGAGKEKRRDALQRGGSDHV